MTLTRDELAERRDQALHDLAELERQLAGGEITPSTADGLRRRYEAEAAAAIEALRGRTGAPTGDVSGAVPRTPRQRWFAGALTAAAVLAAAALLLPRYLSDRPAGGYITGNEAAAPTADLGAVSDGELEGIVAANPDVVGMRLALARRYFVSGDYGRAFDHYEAVLEREPHPEALANLGWIVYRTTNEVRVAASLLEASLERDPDDVLATWFLANVRLDGLEDRSGAVELARRLLARDDLPARDRRAVEDLLERAGGPRP